MVSDIERLQMSSEHNFMCFAIACVDLINLPLIDILTYCIKPEKLYNKLSNSSLTTGKNKLREGQLNICFIPPPELPNYKDFDVSLLYTLIRNLCPSVKPTQGWGIEPIDSDTQVGDDIERLRLFRNTYYGHADSTIIPDDVFEDLWTGLKSVIQRLQIYTTNWRTTNYEEKLAKIEGRRCTDEDRKKYKLLLEAALYVFKHADGKDDPQILITGKDKVTCGETAHFESEIKTSETAELCKYSFTWCKGITLEVIETTCKKYTGSSNRQLVIKEVCKEDEGDYQAVLSRESNGNTFKIFSNIIHLLPEGEKPHFEEWKVTTGSEGITIHYSYGDEANLPKVQEIKWAKNGVQLDCEGDKYKGGGLNDKSFTITSPAEDDSGTYSCTVRNAVGSETNDVTFDVPDANIPIIPTACFGSETKFDPKVVSCPLPDGVQWQKSKDDLTYECIDITEAKYYGSRLDPESPKLVITKTTFEDMLYYRLFIWNKIGESYSNATHLNVTGRAPHIWTSHEIKDIVKPWSLRLIGKVFVNDQSPTIDTIYWTKDGKKIKTLEGGDKYSEGSTEDPSLFIQNVNCHDVGTYQLTAINAVGSNESNIVLGVPQIFIKRSKNLHDDQCFTATIESIPAAYDAYWKVKRKDDDLFSTIDVNAEEYKGTSNSLPCPVLVVKKNELLESQQFYIEVHNFVGSQIQEISAEELVEIPDTSCRTKDDMSSNIFNKKGLTIRFNNLRLNLIKSLKDRDTDVHELKDSLEAITSERSLFRNINSIEDFFRQMLDKGVLNERNVIIVQYLMRQIGRPDLEEMCFEYASKSKQVLCYHENPRCQDEPRVLLHVNDDIEHFTTMESLLQTVASIVDCTLDDIKIVKLQPDQSFIIIITMRAELIRILKETDPHYLRKLLQFNVDWIQIEKCVVKIVTETSSDSVCDTDGKHKQLPQIVGLTESDNVVRTKYEKEALDFVLSYFDKLSTDRLRVGEDKTELAQQVEIPDQGAVPTIGRPVEVVSDNFHFLTETEAERESGIPRPGNEDKIFNKLLIIDETHGTCNTDGPNIESVKNSPKPQGNVTDQSMENSEDSSDDDTGIYNESYRKSEWLCMPDEKSPSLLQSSSIAEEEPESDEVFIRGIETKLLDKSHKRTESTTTTCSESEFKHEYRLRRKCMVHRHDSQQKYQRMSAKVYEHGQLVEIYKDGKDTHFGFCIFDTHPAFITEVDQGSPAQRAGLKAGQVLLSVNGVNVLKLSHQEIIKLVRKDSNIVKLGVASSDVHYVRNQQTPVMSGYMYKQSNSTFVKNWRRRYFVLRFDNCLYYYKGEQDQDSLGVIPLLNYIVSKQTDSSGEHYFKAEKFGARTYYFIADSRKEMIKWVSSLNEAATRAKEKKDVWMDVTASNVELPALDIKRPDCFGYLLWYGLTVRTWKKRYCVLKDACIYYYKNINSSSAQGMAHLHGYKVENMTSSLKKHVFVLRPPEPQMRTFSFCAENETHKERWMAALEKSIQRWIKVVE